MRDADLPVRRRVLLLESAVGYFGVGVVAFGILIVPILVVVLAAAAYTWLWRWFPALAH